MPVVLQASEENPLYVAYVIGVSTNTDLKEIMYLEDQSIAQDHTYIAKIQVSRDFISNFHLAGAELDLRWFLAVAHREENDYATDQTEFVGGVELNWDTHLPWTEIPFTLQLAEGISAMSLGRSTHNEKQDLAKRYEINDDRDPGVLNYIGFSALLGLKSIEALSNCKFGYHLHHRSGVYAKVKLFGYVHGGSNEHSLMLECAY